MSALSRPPILAALAALALISLAAPSARADVIIKTPKDHITYKVELEPHLDLAFLHYRVDGFKDPKGAPFGAPEFGGGFRASIPIVDPGFVPKINDMVAITFGADITGCPSYCNYHAYFRIPVGIQWNFYITKEFSAFGDVGFMLGVATAGAGKGGGVFPDFFVMPGGRYMFSDKVSFTFRVGYPFVTVGASIFVG